MDLSKYGVSSDNKILGVALTHTSYANEHNVPSYERLEYLGDAVLELIIFIRILIIQKEKWVRLDLVMFVKLH